jgi:hypothetical protein
LCKQSDGREEHSDQEDREARERETACSSAGRCTRFDATDACRTEKPDAE